MASTLYGSGKLALVLRARRGLPSRAYLAAIRQKLPERIYLFVVDVINILFTEI